MTERKLSSILLGFKSTEMGKESLKLKRVLTLIQERTTAISDSMELKIDLYLLWSGITKRSEFEENFLVNIESEEEVVFESNEDIFIDSAISDSMELIMELIQPSEYTNKPSPKKVQFAPNKKMGLIQPLKLGISNETNNNILTVDLIHPLKEDSINSNNKNKIMEMIQPLSVTKVTRTNSNKVSTKGVPNKIHPLEVNNNSTENESITVSEKVMSNLTGEQQHSEIATKKSRRRLPKKKDSKAVVENTVDTCLGLPSQKKAFAGTNKGKKTKEVVGQKVNPHNQGTSSRGFYRLIPTPISAEVGESVNVRISASPYHVVYGPVVQQPIDEIDTMDVRMGFKPSLPVSSSSTSTEGLCSEFVKACTF